MFNIEIKLEDSLKNKIDKVKIYRVSRLIQNDIANYFKNIGIFKYHIIKKDLTIILNKYDLNYTIDYKYNEIIDKVVIKIENNMLIEIEVKYEDYSI